MNKNKKEAVESEMAALKKVADIEFIGPFSEMELEKVSTLEAEDKDSLVPQPKANTPMDKSAEQSTLDKGLAGF